MGKKFYLLITLLCALLLPHWSWAQTFEIPITVSDGTNSMELVIGVHPDGSANFEESLDVPAPPPSPSGFDARLIRETALPFKVLSTDIVSNTPGQKLFEMQYQPGSEAGPIQLSWESADLPADAPVTIEDDDQDGSAFELDMSMSNSLDTSIDPDLANGLKVYIDLQPQVEVVAPNGGETWQLNTKRTIEWSTRYLSGTVDIELLRNGSSVATIASNTADDGSYEWQIPDDQTAGGGYKIEVVASDGSASDQSDGSFTLGSPPELDISPQELTFASGGNVKTFSVSNDGGGTLSWSVSESASWLSVAPSSGSGPKAIEVTAVENTSTSPRTASVFVDAGDAGSQTVEVNQLGSLVAPTPTAEAGDSRVDLSWEAASSSSIAGYNLYRSTSPFSDPSDAGKLNSTLIQGTSYVDASVTNGTTYYYRLTVEGAGGTESDASEQVTATPKANGSSPFFRVVSGLRGVQEGSSEWGDYDGDGDLDLIVTGRMTPINTGDGFIGPESATIYENDGSGRLVAVDAGLTPVFEGSSSDWGDIDGDGDLDLVVTGCIGPACDNPVATIYENDGSGRLSLLGADLTGVGFGSSDWGDIDGDGDLDLVITGDNAVGKSTATIYRNDGASTFVKTGAALTGVSDGDADWGDFDGDGDFDLIITGFKDEGGGVTKIYENDGTGSFSPVDVGLRGNECCSSDWGDFDADGDLDIAIFSGLGTEIYRNDGTGNFSPIDVDLKRVVLGAPDWGDIDGDGDLDLLVTGLNDSGIATATVYENNENSFSPLDANLKGVGRSASDWGDIDGDGDLDLVISGKNTEGTPTTIVYRNSGPPSSTSPSPPTGLTAADGGMEDVLLTWNASPEADLAGYNIYRATAPFDTPMAGRRINPNPIPSTEYLDTDVTDGMTYYYRITAIDEAGNESTVSDAVQVTLGTPPRSCYPDLPDPILAFQGTEDYVANGQEWTRYDLSVVNRSEYPTELFETAPDLPPCGSNTNAARSWANIYNGSGSYEYGFCALGDPEGLGDIWFSTSRGEAPPPATYIEIRDRACDRVYRSNAVSTGTVAENDDVDLSGLELSLSFPKLSGKADLTAERDTVEASQELGLPGTQATAINSIWTIELNPPPSDFTAEVCFGLQNMAYSNVDMQQLQVHKRPSGGGSWAQVSSTELRPSATDPERICATGLNSFSEFVVTAEEQALPVDLVAFDAARDGDVVHLSWQTASETKNAGFEVQRRVEAASAFERIGFVEGAGTSSEPRSYQFDDANLPFDAERATYRLKQIDLDGSFEYSSEVEVALGAPERLTLHGNYPNPVRHRTTIRYELPQPSEVTLVVYDVLGQRIATLAAEQQAPGRKEVVFDTSGLASGTYFYRLEAGDHVATQSMTVVR